MAECELGNDVMTHDAITRLCRVAAWWGNNDEQVGVKNFGHVIKDDVIFVSTSDCIQHPAFSIQ